MDRFPSPAPLLPEILALHGKWRAPHPAVCCAGKTLDWAAFCAANHRFAHGLLSRGIVPGDRVGVVMSNGLPMVQALFGTLAAGAVSVPLNLSVNDDAVVAMLVDGGVRALVVTADQQPRLAALRRRLPGSVVLWLTSGEGGDGWDSIDDLCAGRPDTVPARPGSSTRRRPSISSTAPVPPACRRASCTRTGAGGTGPTTWPSPCATTAPRARC